MIYKYSRYLEMTKNFIPIIVGTAVSIDTPAADITTDIQHDASAGDSVELIISSNLDSYT